MNDLLRAESLKLRTLLLPRLMLLLAALGAGFIMFAVVQIANDAHIVVSATDLATAAAQPLWFLVVVVAVLATAGEFQHRTIHSTLLQVPRRGRLLAAKTVVAAAYGATITLIGTLCAIAVGLVSLKLKGMPLASVDVDMLAKIAESVTIGALLAVLAAGLGMLARSATVALVALLLWRFVLEGILPAATRHPDLARWLPSRAADALLFGRAELLAPWAGGLLLAGYAAAATLAGAWLFSRWDA
jgi:ABC-2 type transport system permease protein